MMMKLEIKDYPIFEVGTWNKMEFTEDDVQAIADTYKELESMHQVPLKLGHNDEQPLTDGQPALGWVKNVRRVGKQLLADFSDMPKVIVEMIKKKRFRAVSVELLMGLKRGEKTYKHVLDAVAILGAEQPAVHTLPDLNLFLAKRSLAYDEGGRRVRFERQVDKVSFNKPANRGGSMDEEQREELKRLVAAAVAPLNERIDTQQKEIADWRKKFSEEEDKRIRAESETKRIKLEDEERAKAEKKARVKMARDAVTAVFEEAVKARVITPAQRESDMSLLGVDDDERVVKMHAEIDKLRVRLMGDKKGGKTTMSQKKGDEGESTAHGGSDDELPEGRTHRDVFKEVDFRTRKKMSEDATGRATYSSASKAVFLADPDLHREYLNTTPPEKLAGGDA